MLNILFFIFLVFLIFVVGGILYVVHIIYRAYHRVKDTFSGQTPPNGNTRQGGSTSGNTSGSQSRRQQRATTVTETLYDTRPREVAERKIFSKDEGEYVDFIEE